ncbi:hypothetical protein SUGI_0678270 [Cryptomeria japonica]|nr:hypothetical protein SUGI_0678270 [Cryptomeria japonica]
MVHRFGLSCLCRKDMLEAQCEHLLDIDIKSQNAIQGLLDDAFSEEWHWEEDIEAVGGGGLEVDKEWASILGPYFNPLAILSNAECSDLEDEIWLAAEALRTRKGEFMAEAWEVFRVGVKNADMGPFRRMMMQEDGWLSEGSIDKVATIGMRVASILRLM